MRWFIVAAFASCIAVRAFGAVPAPAAKSVPAPELTAEQIIEKNVAARGGLEPWRKIETMVWAGHMEQAGGPMASVQFVLQQKRPNKTRFEVNAIGERSVRVFNGANGWKVRPAADGSPDVQQYTPQEAKFARDESVIDGPLIDYQAKGTSVALEGVEEVEGREAYRLRLRLASGERHSVWVDAQTFLEIRYDRTSYNPAGVPGTVSVFYRDYKSIDGLQIPSVLEIGTGSGKAPDKMVIEKIALNPPLDDRVFARPGRPSRRHSVTIEPPASAAGGTQMRPPAAPSAGPAAGPVPE
ncbi:MAG TPA: hypothetical protein VNW98_08850 [Burkholderiaceae bacterium]|nr:hypothetical protein [Burkholderiaceae bacterium]